MALMSILNGRAIIDLEGYAISVPASEVVIARVEALKFASDSSDLLPTTEPVDPLPVKAEGENLSAHAVGVDASVEGVPVPFVTPQGEGSTSDIALVPLTHSPDTPRPVVAPKKEDRPVVEVLPTVRQVPPFDQAPLAVQNITIDMPLFDFERLAAIQAAVENTNQYLSRAAGKTNVHDLAAYYKELWKSLNTPEILGYSRRESQQFIDIFERTIKEIECVLSHVNTDKILRIGDANIKLKAKRPYNIHNLRLALAKMRSFGRHAGGSDWDNEVNAHVNEVLVYVWHQVKLDPNLIYTFLSNLIDAAPTCIQGHTVRLLYTIHQYDRNLF